KRCWPMGPQDLRQTLSTHCWPGRFQIAASDLSTPATWPPHPRTSVNPWFEAFVDICAEHTANMKMDGDHCANLFTPARFGARETNETKLASRRNSSTA